MSLEIRRSDDHTRFSMATALNLILTTDIFIVKFYEQSSWRRMHNFSANPNMQPHHLISFNVMFHSQPSPSSCQCLVVGHEHFQGWKENVYFSGILYTYSAFSYIVFSNYYLFNDINTNLNLLEAQQQIYSHDDVPLS